MPRLNWLAGTGHAGFAGLDFNEIPVSTVNASSESLFIGWRRLCQLKLVRNPPKFKVLLTECVAVLTSTTAEPSTKILQVAERIGRAVGVAAANVSAASTRLMMTTADKFLDPIQIAGLVELTIVMRRLGASGDEVDELSRDTVTEATPRLVRKLLYAKFGASTPDIIRKVTDVIRVRQRNALVDYLVHRDKLRDANDLYEYYLIDPQSSPRLKTTRLLQATQSVQLFVMRCLLN